MIKFFKLLIYFKYTINIFYLYLKLSNNKIYIKII